jgi:hypothetical protein
MGMLQRFESRLEHAVSGAFAKAFRSAVQPVELAAALQREVDNSAQILSRNRRLVPNTFRIQLSEMDFGRLSPYQNTLIQELVEMLREHADEQHYVFAGPVTIDLEQDDSLVTGRFRVHSAATASVSEGRRSRSATVGRGDGKDDGEGDGSGDTGVSLEINGTRHTVHPPGLVIGRSAEADLRINDPGISRRHAEIRVGGRERPEVTVVDLGSTNGTMVDGSRVRESRLRDGQRVRVGNTDIVVRVGRGG